MIAIIIGLTNFPNIKPNFIHIKFNGFNKFDFRRPKIKNTKEINRGMILISESDFNGQRAMIRKNIKKTIPKLLLDGSFIFSFFI